MGKITPSHIRSDTLPPLLPCPWPHTPSHPRSLTHQSDVSRSKMPGGSTLIELLDRSRLLGRDEEAVSPHTLHHARCVHHHAHETNHTKPHMLPHTPSPPPMAPYTLPPSLPDSLERREPVKDARRQHADRVAGQAEAPGHETRRQSAPTHSTSTCPLRPSACTCMCPMHMRHAHARVHRASLSLFKVGCGWVGFEFARRVREKVRGEYRVLSSRAE